MILDYVLIDGHFFFLPGLPTQTPGTAPSVHADESADPRGASRSPVHPSRDP